MSFGTTKNFYLLQLGVIKIDLKHHFAQDEKFWIVQGVRMNEMNRAEYIVLLFIALLTYYLQFSG